MFFRKKMPQVVLLYRINQEVPVHSWCDISQLCIVHCRECALGIWLPSFQPAGPEIYGQHLETCFTRTRKHPQWWYQARYILLAKHLCEWELSWDFLGVSTMRTIPGKSPCTAEDTQPYWIISQVPQDAKSNLPHTGEIYESKQAKWRN